VHSGGDSDRR